MRVCQSCGRENPDDNDFCTCGEYLRWEPTSYMPALDRPGPAEQAAPSPADAPTGAAGKTPPPPLDVPSHPTGGQAAPPEPEPAAITLRLPDAAAAPGDAVSAAVKPGAQTTLLALVRNQSGIVDNYDLHVGGLPAGWWAITPATVYLVPFGSSGEYEQEVQIHLHPPRTAEAVARPWPFEVVAESKATGARAASAGATLVIAPYEELETEVRPERRSGRRKARYTIAVKNRANAPAEVALLAQDTDGACRFDFAAPTVTVSPGEAVEDPLTVRPPKQIWIGRPLERRFQVTTQHVGADQPLTPRQAAFSQRPWLPWWLLVALPLLLAFALVLWLLLPSKTVVPDVTKAKGIFEAQQQLDDAHLKLAPQVQQRRVPGAGAGTIIDQSPPAGKEVEEDSEVTLLVAVGSGRATVPSVVGLKPAAADKLLRRAHLMLGAVQPQPDPNGTIASQIPAAQQAVDEGTPVNVFLASQKAGGGAAEGGGADGEVKVPEVAGLGVAEAAAKLSAAGLVPQQALRLSAAKRGSLVGTEPGAGAALAAGAEVKLIVSGGFPRVAFDDGQDVFVMGGATGRPIRPLAKGPEVDEEPAWSPDSRRVAYTSGGRIFIVDTPAPPVPVRITSGKAEFKNPSFAPTARGDVLALVRRTNDDGDLCLSQLGAGGARVSCIDDPDFNVGRQGPAWFHDGRRLLIPAARAGTETFGLMLYTSTVPFSTNASDWGSGTLVTDASRERRGVIWGAWSPDGKALAVISNISGGPFRVVVTGPDDFLLSQARTLPVRGCHLAWRPDGRELAVMQADAACQERTGQIVRLNPRKPTRVTPLGAVGGHPAWQPLRIR